MTEPYDAREPAEDPSNDPATIGETSFEEPDGDGGAVVQQDD